MFKVFVTNDYGVTNHCKTFHFTQFHFTLGCTERVTND